MFFAFGDRAQEIAFPYDFHYAGHAAHGAFIEADQAASDLWRPDDSPVEHRWHANVVHVAECGGDLGGNIDARN